VFEKALEKARSIATAQRPLVIGDGLETDIAGAKRMGLDALFIAGGIHASELREGPHALAELFAKGGVNAVGVMPVLHW
jgi:ribonucleotide monophosphatase NagD (HAD superfamily)